MPRLINCIFLLLCIVSCRPVTYTPKPKGYYQIDLPATHEYRLFNEPGFPYSFEYPVYATIQKDTSYFGSKPENPYWLYMNFPTLGGVIYLSYKEISVKQPFDKLMEDSYKLSYFHDKKADYIDEKNGINPNGVNIILYSVSGDAASAYQFMATDSVKRFIRGALYFNVTPNADSLKPVNDFLRADIQHLLFTLKWN